jgi:hypothetical protein
VGESVGEAEGLGGHLGEFGGWLAVEEHPHGAAADLAIVIDLAGRLVGWRGEDLEGLEAGGADDGGGVHGRVVVGSVPTVAGAGGLVPAYHDTGGPLDYEFGCRYDQHESEGASQPP